MLLLVCFSEQITFQNTFNNSLKIYGTTNEVENLFFIDSVGVRKALVVTFRRSDSLAQGDTMARCLLSKSVIFARIDTLAQSLTFTCKLT